MRNSTSIALVGTLAALASFGLGCGPSESPVSLDKYPMPQQSAGVDQFVPPQNNSDQQASSTQPTATTTQATASSTIETAPAPQQPPAPTTTSMTQPETLAFPGVMPESELANKQVRITTAKGDIVFELLPKEGPKAASNFYYLVNHKFYNGLTFHRVEPDFVIQGGDPLGNGTGGPGYKFEDDKVNLPYKQGIVAMANAGPNTNGSQFFIMLADKPLPPNYSVFGRVVSGMEVVLKIAVGDKMENVSVEPLKK